MNELIWTLNKNASTGLGSDEVQNESREYSYCNCFNHSYMESRVAQIIFILYCFYDTLPFRPPLWKKNLEASKEEWVYSENHRDDWMIAL